MPATTTLNVPLQPETLLPDLFSACPEARAVFNRYGLRGCGGQRGPAETIEFFARAHGVDLHTLLAEVREVAQDADTRRRAREQLDADNRTRLADSIYRPFFLAGLIVILTVGAGWGVLLLLKIGTGGSFTGVTVHEINAHGHAQVMGWVGLFIMGFAYQAFPRMWQVELPSPGLALGSLAAVLLGIICRVLAMAYAGAAWAMSAHFIGVGLEVLAACTFLGLIITAFVRSGQRLEPYSAFIFAALFFFLAQTAMGGWHVAKLITAPSREAELAQIATYQGPLRDIQIHGMAMLMIFGVGLRLFPALFGFREIGRRRAWWAFGLLATAVVLEVGLFLAFRVTERMALAASLLLPWLMLPIGAWLVVGGWKPWRAGAAGERSRKFVLAALLWLFVSFGMLLAMPAYLAVYPGDFSHAYHGAVRHAITVGFVSLMIMGMAAKVVATLNGLDTRRLTALWGPLVLVNVGCALRVSLQIATDWSPRAFSAIGVSGVLELAGLGWWAWHLVGMMVRRHRTSAEDEQLHPARLCAYHTVGQTVAWFPESIETLAALGFTPIRNPILRRTLARRVTLAQAAAFGKVPLVQLLDTLNASIEATDHAQGESPRRDGCCCCCKDNCSHEHD